MEQGEEDEGGKEGETLVFWESFQKTKPDQQLLIKKQSFLLIGYMKFVSQTYFNVIAEST